MASVFESTAGSGCNRVKRGARSERQDAAIEQALPPAQWHMPINRQVSGNARRARRNRATRSRGNSGCDRDRNNPHDQALRRRRRMRVR